MNFKLLWKGCAFGMLFLMFSSISYAQVGVNTTSPASGALLDVFSSDKGFIMPRVALQATNITAPITPAPATGLMVYNTVTDGTPLSVQVTPGFYYWSGSQWARLYNQGYTLYYTQSAQVQAVAPSTTYVQLPSLDTGVISVPFSGTYQIRVNANMAAGTLIATTSDGASQGSVSLWQETNAVPAAVPVKENYLTSSSKRIGSTTINSLAQNTTIIWNVDLDADDTHRFYVMGREWLQNNVGFGWFGKDTNGYSGASGVNTALRGTMTITLIKQQ